jgi:hypothetical protein
MTHRTRAVIVAYGVFVLCAGFVQFASEAWDVAHTPSTTFITIARVARVEVRR